MCGWLTHGDMAMDPCAHFFAVAEHRSIGHHLRKVIVSLSGLLLVKTRSLMVMLRFGLLVFAVRP